MLTENFGCTIGDYINSDGDLSKVDVLSDVLDCKDDYDSRQETEHLADLMKCILQIQLRTKDDAKLLDNLTDLYWSDYPWKSKPVQDVVYTEGTVQIYTRWVKSRDWNYNPTYASCTITVTPEGFIIEGERGYVDVDTMCGIMEDKTWTK